MRRLPFHRSYRLRRRRHARVLADRPVDGTGPTVIFDLDCTPAPEVPFPNDLAYRLDPSSPTSRFLNVSEEASARMEYELPVAPTPSTGLGPWPHQRAL